MKTLLTLFALGGLSACLLAEDATPAIAGIPDIAPFLVPSLEDRYAVEASKAEAIAAKAEAEAAKAKRLAADARLKGYKDKLIEITKTGDFDKAQQVKARITQLENEPEGESHKPEKPTKRPRPKDTVKFGGHTYALIKEPATWHVAKLRCEEMGGHLVVLDNPKEAPYLIELLKKDGVASAWIGATDELIEGDWRWVDGTDAKFSSPHIGNSNGGEHYMELNVQYGFNDGGANRSAYLCEWPR